jgi:hypothetical protein
VRTPKDQGLFLTVFIGICVTVVLVMWIALPVHIKLVIEGEDDNTDIENPAPEPLTLKPAVTPEERIAQMEQAVSMAQSAVKDLEKSESEKAGSEKAGSEKAGSEKAGTEKAGSNKIGTEKTGSTKKGTTP